MLHDEQGRVYLKALLLCFQDESVFAGGGKWDKGLIVLVPPAIAKSGISDRPEAGTLASVNF